MSRQRGKNTRKRAGKPASLATRLATRGAEPMGVAERDALARWLLGGPIVAASPEAGLIARAFDVTWREAQARRDDGDYLTAHLRAATLVQRMRDAGMLRRGGWFDTPAAEVVLIAGYTSKVPVTRAGLLGALL